MTDTLNIEATRTTPAVQVDKEKGVMKIEGRFISESYESACHLLSSGFDMVEGLQIPFRINIQLSLTNKPSRKCLYAFFKRLNQMYENGREITINWFYEADDEDILDAGKDFAEKTRLPFNYIAYNNIVM